MLERTPKGVAGNSIDTAIVRYPLDFSLRSSPIPFQRKGTFDVPRDASVFCSFEEPEKLEQPEKPLSYNKKDRIS